jgi:hypothetical protein
MERRDLTATNWFAARLKVAFLCAAAGFFLLRPSWLGWTSVTEWAGGETRLLGVGMALALFWIARLSWEKDQLRVGAAELMEALNQLLYGKDYASQRQAIEILLDALDARDDAARNAAHEHLVRLTGQHFAADARVWRAWWDAHRKTWSSRK